MPLLKHVDRASPGACVCRRLIELGGLLLVLRFGCGLSLLGGSSVTPPQPAPAPRLLGPANLRLRAYLHEWLTLR